MSDWIERHKRRLKWVLGMFAAVQPALLAFLIAHPEMSKWNALEWFQFLGIIGLGVYGALSPSVKPRKKWSDAKRLRERIKKKITEENFHSGNK